MSLTIADTLKYANLQMAAEAFLVDNNNKPLTDPTLLKQALIRGNDHTSHFTEQSAADFTDPVKGWTVLNQEINTKTGFSGTLFKNNQTDELVISFRSTEFIDDAVRDSKATNELEIKNTGFAWGQIADMEKWYSDLTKVGGLLYNKPPVTVTGCSLGGHLATAFNMLHGATAASQVVTFNGAGIGIVNTGNLKTLVDEFAKYRNSAIEIEKNFTDPNLKPLYDDLSSRTYSQPQWGIAA